MCENHLDRVTIALRLHLERQPVTLGTTPPFLEDFEKEAVLENSDRLR